MMRKFDQSRSVYIVSRRDLYLLLWGGVYLLLGSYNYFTFNDYFWTGFFWFAGFSALIGSLYNSMWKKAMAFSLLAAVSALRGFSYVTPFLFSINVEPDISLGAGLLYLGITLSHVLVSGWHDGKILETPDESDRTELKGD